MSEFDTRAKNWDSEPMHWERSEAIAQKMLEMVPLKSDMKAMEYGAGTGILSFLLSDKFSEITLMDNSPEMVKVMNEKLVSSKVKNMKPVLFDLEHSDYPVGSFDCIFTQMVLHHVDDTLKLLNKFYQILTPGGFLAVADLYSEDGSFHGLKFTGHKGFDVNRLQEKLKKVGFVHTSVEQCYTVKKAIDNQLRKYPVFLLIALK